MRILILYFLLFTFCFNANAQKYSDGNAVIAAMYKAYNGGKKWYKYFTFSQETHFIKDGKEEKMEIWHEAGYFPGKLIIKFNTKDSKNGILFTDQKVYGYTEGKEPFSRPKIHELLLGAFDIYFLKPEVSAHLFDSLGFNLKLVREDVFDGRKVIVVGAEKNDSTSKQFWIDAERFYLHRIVYARKTSVSDCIFGNYEKINNYWVAKTITFKADGKPETVENYFDIKFPKKLDDSLFDPKKFNEIKLE